MPCGIDLVGTTYAGLPALAAACMAAGMMLRLLGSRTTASALALSAASFSSRTLGFIVSPPETMPITPRSRKTASIPSPSATATIATWATSCRSRENSACCSSMLVMLTSLSTPLDTARLITGPGSSACTWILTMVSSPTTTGEPAIAAIRPRISSTSSPSPSTRSCVQ